MNTLTIALLAGVASTLLVSTTACAQAPAEPFQAGLADRGRWESWFATLSGDTKAGAEYWAGQRSVPRPGSCFDRTGQSLGDFTTGCMEAQDRLAPTDERRKNEPAYRDGWNAWTPTPTPPQAAATTPQSFSGPPVAAPPPPSSTERNEEGQPQAQPSRTASNNPEGIPLKQEGGALVIPVLINGQITLNFTIDSGSSDVQIPEDVVSTLMRTGTLQKSDFIGQEKFRLADGSIVPSNTLLIRSLKVGNHLLENVEGSVANSKADLLLGQSFLKRFNSWSIDNTRQVLLLNPPPGAPQASTTQPQPVSLEQQSAIAATDLLVSNVTLRNMWAPGTVSIDGFPMTEEETEGNKWLTGTITNNSGQTLRTLQFEVTLKDCTPGSSPTDGTDQCQIVGQERTAPPVKIPPGQTRAFKWSVHFSGLVADPNRERSFSLKIVTASSCPWVYGGMPNFVKLKCEDKPQD